MPIYLNECTPLVSFCNKQLIIRSLLVGWTQELTKCFEQAELTNVRSSKSMWNANDECKWILKISMSWAGVAWWDSWTVKSKHFEVEVEKKYFKWSLLAAHTSSLSPPFFRHNTTNPIRSIKLKQKFPFFFSDFFFECDDYELNFGDVVKKVRS